MGKIKDYLLELEELNLNLTLNLEQTHGKTTLPESMDCSSTPRTGQTYDLWAPPS